MTVAAPAAPPALLWNIFCKVIDNYGDIGVCWRLSSHLAARGERVRLWLDDASALRWMAPHGCPGVEVMAWTQPFSSQGLDAGDVLIEAFGCQVAPEFIAACAEKAKATGQNIVWINLEYLSAEGFVERSHGLPSPVLSGPGASLRKHFFYPGFTSGTGGLLREPDLAQRQSRFDRAAWLRQLGIELRGERLISLFCYEPPALAGFLAQLARHEHPTRLLVTPGRATDAVRALIDNETRRQPLWNQRATLSISYLPAFSQMEFDHLLWASDFNFVRGEDSLVRALWAGKPFVWQIYPQHDDAHHSKLEAFLDAINAPATLRAFHRSWNGVDKKPLGELELATWGQTARDARSRLMQQTDLCSQLLEFVRSVRISNLS